MGLSLSHHCDGHVTTIEVGGDVDHDTSPQLQEYASGLRVLQVARHRAQLMGGWLRLSCLPRQTLRLLEIVGSEAASMPPPVDMK
jgi:anti-anti-sigma regulatory factor